MVYWATDLVKHIVVLVHSFCYLGYRLGETYCSISTFLFPITIISYGRHQIQYTPMNLSSSLDHYITIFLACAAGVDAVRARSSLRQLQAMSIDIQEDIPDLDVEPEYTKGGSSKKSKSRSSDDTPTFGLNGPSTFNSRTGENVVNGECSYMLHTESYSIIITKTSYEYILFTMHFLKDNLTLQNNVNCDLLTAPLGVKFCINIDEDDVTLDCNGHSIIGGGGMKAGNGIGITGSSVIVKNCKVENFETGIEALSGASVTIESTTVSNNGIGFAQNGAGFILKNALAENNNVGIIATAQPNNTKKLGIDNVYSCNNSEVDIKVNDAGPLFQCPEIEASGQVFASIIDGNCSAEATINNSLDENGYDPIVLCTNLNAQQTLN